MTSKDGNRACPECGKKKRGNKHHKTALEKVGSIFENMPELVKEWDVEKNGEDLPNKYTAGSSHAVWWKCSVCGNEWRARISNRAILKRGCPKCTQKNRDEKRKNLFYAKKPEKVFNSINEAALFAKVSASKITACCKGKQKTAGGYSWKYVKQG